MPFVKKKLKEETEIEESDVEEVKKLEQKEPQYITIPRVISKEEMLNAIYDLQLENRNLLLEIKKELG